MTLNHMTRQWAKFAVLSMVLVGAPGAARAEEAAGTNVPRKEEAQRTGERGNSHFTGPGCLPLEGTPGMKFRELEPQTYEVTPGPEKAELHCGPPNARIVPSFSNGVSRGFKLFSIRPDSVYSRAGLRNGDVLLSINGWSLSSPEKALEVYSKLKEASRVEAEIERDGKRLRLIYLVKREPQR